MARLLSLLLLYQAGYEVGRYISLERIIEESKESYYESSRYPASGGTRAARPVAVARYFLARSSPLRNWNAGRSLHGHAGAKRNLIREAADHSLPTSLEGIGTGMSHGQS